MEVHVMSPEDRLCQVEIQLQHLVKWKELFISSLGLAVAANADLFQTGGYPPVLPRYVKSIQVTPGDAETVELGSGFQISNTVQIAEGHPETAAHHVETANRVLDIIQGYGKHLGNPQSDHDQHNWPGRAKFAPKVLGWVEQNAPVRMILPAFPWKSVNRVEKVLGALPDFGEELALARLDRLCKDIGNIYAPGAEVHVATDGLVFVKRKD